MNVALPRPLAISREDNGNVSSAVPQDKVTLSRERHSLMLPG